MNRFIENLKAQTPFVRCAERRELPMNSGNQLELFMYNTFGANTQQVSEGTVPSGISASVGTTTATIGFSGRIADSIKQNLTKSGKLYIINYRGNMKILLTVEMDVKAIDLQDRHTPVKSEDWDKFKSEINGQIVKIKSGVYENALMGSITKVDFVRQSRRNR